MSILAPGRRGRRGERGQSLAEFAIVAPIFFLLVFGVIQIGLVLAAQNGLVDGARNAARRAATYRINDGSFDSSVWPAICTAITNEISVQMSQRVIAYTPSRLTKTVTYEWQRNPEGGEYFLVAHISASYKNQLYVPLIGAFLDGSDGVNDNALTLTASEQMRIENPALEFTSAPVSAPAC